MQIGVISDIHGNLPALEQVLNELEGVDELVCIGDVVGYGPHPSECISRTRSNATTTLYGNHESYLESPRLCKGNSDAYEGIQHALRELSDDQYTWTQNLPLLDTILDEKFALVHGYPDHENPFKYVKKSNATELIPYFREQDWNLLAVGHSHIQFQLDLRKFHDEAGILFNPGSVGQPRDNDPKAAYAIVDTETMTVDLHRVKYDIDATVEAINEVGLPEASAMRLQTGSYPSSNSQRGHGGSLWDGP